MLSVWALDGSSRLPRAGTPGARFKARDRSPSAAICRLCSASISRSLQLSLSCDRNVRIMSSSRGTLFNVQKRRLFGWSHVPKSLKREPLPPAAVLLVPSSDEEPSFPEHQENTTSPSISPQCNDNRYTKNALSALSVFDQLIFLSHTFSNFRRTTSVSLELNLYPNNSASFHVVVQRLCWEAHNRKIPITCTHHPSEYLKVKNPKWMGQYRPPCPSQRTPHPGIAGIAVPSTGK